MRFFWTGCEPKSEGNTLDDDDDLQLDVCLCV